MAGQSRQSHSDVEHGIRQAKSESARTNKNRAAQTGLTACGHRQSRALRSSQIPCLEANAC